MAFTGKGFIVDAPKALIRTASRNLHVATASQGSITLGGDSLEINGGWSFYNLARIDTKKSIAIAMTDAQWDFDQLIITSGGAKTISASEYYYFGTPYTVGAVTNTITLPHLAVAGSIEINGLDLGTATPSASEFFAQTVGGVTELSFNVALAGTKVYPAYKVATTPTTEILTVQTNDFAEACSCTIQFPIYSDADATNSTIEAYAQLTCYKMKVMPTYEIGGSYKSASTFKLDLQGLDPRRSDGNMWEFIVVPA